MTSCFCTEPRPLHGHHCFAEAPVPLQLIHTKTESVIQTAAISIPIQRHFSTHLSAITVITSRRGHKSHHSAVRPTDASHLHWLLIRFTLASAAVIVYDRRSFRSCPWVVPQPPRLPLACRAVGVRFDVVLHLSCAPAGRI